MVKFHGLTTRLDPLGARYRHREKADRNSNKEAVAVCSLPSPDVGLFPR
jgi:hypothetical protein